MGSGLNGQVTVVLVHGLALWPGWMRPMARRLERRGWPVERVGYRSTRQGIAASIAEVRGQLMPGRPVNLVGHSLGGLIAAALLREPGGLEIGRVVQIGTPNLGSPMADRANRVALTRWFYGPVLPELRVHDQMPPVEDRIGAVAGDIWPNLSGGRGDGTVQLHSATGGAGHHVTVPVMHSLLPVSSRVAARVAQFLADGRFKDREA